MLEGMCGRAAFTPRRFWAASCTAQMPSSHQGKQSQHSQQKKQMSSITSSSSVASAPTMGAECHRKMCQIKHTPPLPCWQPPAPAHLTTQIPMQSCIRVIPQTNPFPRKSGREDGRAHARTSACPMSPIGHTCPHDRAGCTMVWDTLACPEPPMAGSSVCRPRGSKALLGQVLRVRQCSTHQPSHHRSPPELPAKPMLLAHHWSWI